jgi:hypothetical protein
LRNFAIALIFSISINSLYARDVNYKELRSEHFIIEFYKDVDESYVSGVKEMSEDFYREITQEFGLVRDKLWLWENRARIFIAKDKEGFLNDFRCPSWSSACVDYEGKIIYTYPDQAGFPSILVHELTHIIFREYVGKAVLPLWLDEGVATYIENKYLKSFDMNDFTFLKIAINNNSYIKFSQLNQITFSTLNLQAQDYVDIFYLESFSIIYFLLNRYPRDNFSQFLYFLSNGYALEEALLKGFSSFRDMEDLENKWKRFYQE